MQASQITILALLFMWAFLAKGQDSTQPATDHDLQVREEMKQISKELGVTCDHCHNVANYKSHEKPQMAISKEHSRIVELLNKQGFTYKNAPKGTCYMCHRGKAIPDYKMPASN